MDKKTHAIAWFNFNPCTNKPYCYLTLDFTYDRCIDPRYSKSWWPNIDKDLDKNGLSIKYTILSRSIYGIKE